MNASLRSAGVPASQDFADLLRDAQTGSAETPIGHKNNTLIMGPGGYRFGDYWRMGLPLEILVLAVAVPMILWVWPM